MEKIEMPGHTWVAVTIFIWFMMILIGLAAFMAGSITLKFKDIEFELISRTAKFKIEQVEEARELRNIISDLKEDLKGEPKVQNNNLITSERTPDQSPFPSPTSTPIPRDYGTRKIPTAMVDGSVSQKMLNRYEDRIRDFEQRALDPKDSFIKKD